MRYDEFKAMYVIIWNDVTFLHSRGWNKKDISSFILDEVIEYFFFDPNMEMLRCDYNQMKILIQNTVDHLLRA